MTGDRVADPAIEAAQRAWESRYAGRIRDVQHSAHHDGIGALAVASAREALAPLRKLIEDAHTWTPYDTRDIGDAYLADSVHDLLDDLSRLIYREDEL